MESDNSKLMDPDITYMTPQQARVTQEGGLRVYREMTVGHGGIGALAFYEFCMFFSGLPGISGYALRTILYPKLFGKCGTKLVIGKGTVLRNIGKVSLGRGVMIDDYAGIDCKGDSAAIDIGDYVSIGRFSSLVTRDSKIVLHDGGNIGAYTRIGSFTPIEIGKSVLISSYCYIGAGNHSRGSNDKPLIAQGMDRRGGIKIGDYVWIGTHSTVMDGVSIGERAIIGAHSFLNRDVPAGAIAVGAPAKVKGYIDGFGPEKTVAGGE